MNLHKGKDGFELHLCYVVRQEDDAGGLCPPFNYAEIFDIEYDTLDQVYSAIYEYTDTDLYQKLLIIPVVQWRKK